MEIIICSCSQLFCSATKPFPSQPRQGGCLLQSRLQPSGKLYVHRRRDQREGRLLTLPNLRGRGNNSPMRAACPGSRDLLLGGHQRQRLPLLFCRSPWTTTGNPSCLGAIPGDSRTGLGQQGVLPPKECLCSGRGGECLERGQDRAAGGRGVTLVHLSEVTGGSPGLLR